jgi:predicted HNH restriction endonuclease
MLSDPQAARFVRKTDACCLSAHHLDPAKKDFAIGRFLSNGASAKRVLAELVKCICVCENCHRKIHAGLISILAVR